jgi:hypothetical protein
MVIAPSLAAPPMVAAELGLLGKAVVERMICRKVGRVATSQAIADAGVQAMLRALMRIQTMLRMARLSGAVKVSSAIMLRTVSKGPPPSHLGPFGVGTASSRRRMSSLAAPAAFVLFVGCRSDLRQEKN